MPFSKSTSIKYSQAQPEEDLTSEEESPD